MWKGASFEHYIVAKKSSFQIVAHDSPYVKLVGFMVVSLVGYVPLDATGVTLGSAMDGIFATVASSRVVGSIGKSLVCPTVIVGLQSSDKSFSFFVAPVASPLLAEVGCAKISTNARFVVVVVPFVDGYDIAGC